ncbi:MAG: FAD-dependent oxidoreductase [Streptosporangiaceae bacterium]|nr:FAD-dependent oxidoreductase [Streptosporangiaceae bacterium]
MGAERADLVIIGAGLAGSAAAWAAAARGLAAVVIEARQPGHRRGSSHGSARIFRRAYPDPAYVRLAGVAGRLWRQLEDEAGEELLHVTGGLDYGRARDPQRLHEVLAGCAVPAELLPPAAAAERWPGIVFPDDGPVMFHPEAGVIDPERAMAAMLRLAAAAGVSVRHEVPVTRVEAAGGGAVVHTADGPVTAPVVIAAAGPWLEPLLGGLVRLPPLAVTQQQAFHLAQREGAQASWPVFICCDDTYVYGLPAGRDGEVPGAIKLGEHGSGTATTADDRDGVVCAAARARVTAFAAARLPGLDPRPVGELTCLYTSTGTEDFIFDRQGPFVICSACSGHGAKFAPLTGQVAVELACGGRPPDRRFTLAAHLAAV